MKQQEYYESLREKYPEFIYHAYTIEEGEESIKLTYDFEIPGLSHFAPTWTIPEKRTGAKDDPVFQNLVFSLGMVELISYWKISCPKKVVIEPAGLNEAQIKWWKHLYFHGLGEFYYTNGITETEEDFMTITADGPVFAPAKEATVLSESCLVPVGGGKDSSVSLELLNGTFSGNYIYIINPRGATTESAAVAGYDEEHILSVKRTLDANMLRLNKEGYLNGHTPFSAIVAFSATIMAYLAGVKYIVLSNESSANESTVEGSYVNHQYSKSYEFEKDFHDYEKNYVNSGTYYFSFLRPLSEFQIAGLFSKLTKYHPVFKSCNAGSKENIWCGHCSKCLFVWLILSPFLSQEALTKIFGRDMANDPEMQHFFDQLIGLSPEKPFECVGSRDEINAAITLTIRDYPEGAELPYLFRHYKETGRYEQTLPVAEAYYDYYDAQNLLPDPFTRALKQRLLALKG
ncbi:MAG: hypothetical protein K6G07_06305 [Lachnospiraceae bacterium]|nr:hypothetical protein [Lachnospiraceae bacterium]